METTTIKKFIENNSEVTLSLSKYDFANLFSIVNNGEKSYYNICKTLNFIDSSNIPTSLYSVYEFSIGDTWTNLSYKLFGTIRLWWLLCKFNNIENPFEEIIPGTPIKVPGDQIQTEILDLLSKGSI